MRKTALSGGFFILASGFAVVVGLALMDFLQNHVSPVCCRPPGLVESTPGSNGFSSPYHVRMWWNW